jgi:hypothetical protein
LSTGSVVTNPSNTTAHSNMNIDDNYNLDYGQDIGVVGKGKFNLQEKDIYFIYLLFSFSYSSTYKS